MTETGRVRRGILQGGLVALAAIPFTGLAGRLVAAAETAVVIPAPALDSPAAGSGTLQTAVLAGGCFWGVQAVFQHVKGVTKAVSGYAGGTKDTARYNVVSAGSTGHAESVQVTYDPRQISYGRILQIYFSVAHNPTELNRQGPDEGTQYRSAIFFADPEQQRVAQAYIAQLDKAGTFKQPIATQLTKYDAFYPAEAYHQDYATMHPESPYIYYNDLPKVENLKKLFPEVYREQPVLVRSAARS
jgi:peptide-methionine (S)-S-oxide reductase